MYSVDEGDTVEKIVGVPQSSIGAPCPMILMGEDDLHLAYYLQNTPQDWDGSPVRVVTENTAGEPVAWVRFKAPYAQMFGPPNDEAFEGHPLASRGLGPYGVYEIRDSSWIRKLERMNSVHPYHRPEQFSDYRHFVFSFHDTTFECIAEQFEIGNRSGSVVSVLSQALREHRE